MNYMFLVVLVTTLGVDRTFQTRSASPPTDRKATGVPGADLPHVDSGANPKSRPASDLHGSTKRRTNSPTGGGFLTRQKCHRWCI